MWAPAIALILLTNATPPAPEDFDKDGVVDVEDDCPTDPGNPKNKGCPGEVPVAPPPPEPPAKIEVTADRINIEDTVEFKSGSASVDRKSFGLLKDVAAAINSLPPERKISVEGHTDNRGSAARNRSLSKSRARAVIAHLVRYGVAATRLSFKGHGPDAPIATNDSAEGRRKNRRVEFIIHD